jgi:L-fuconolactonase
MRPAELTDAAACVKRNPDLSFVLDHCGNPNPAGDLSAWKRDLAEVARLPNVVCKVSGFLVNAPEGKWNLDQAAAVVNTVLDTFGPDRVLFGGDWPVCLKAAPLGRWLQTVRTIVQTRPIEQQRKLLHDNAVSVYRLW